MTRVSISPGETLSLGVVEVPGSKSHTIRALFVAATARGQSQLYGPLDADDTVAARTALRALGGTIVEQASSWSVMGTNGRFTPSPAAVDVGESGLTARFTLALAAVVNGRTVVTGRGRLPDRPMSGVLDAIRAQGAEVGRSYPWTVIGRGWIPGGDVEVSAEESSQMVSAVLMTAPLARSETRLHRKGGDRSLGYLDISLDVMRHFGATVEVAESSFVVSPGGYESTTYEIPPDASTAVYPLVAAAVTGEQVTVPGRFGDQPDLRVLTALEQMGCQVDLTDAGIKLRGPEELAGISIDMADAPDSSIALAVACALADGPSRIEGLGSLRLKESDRLAALASELTRFGCRVDEGPTWLTIYPARPRPATFSSHNDHRIAMSLALLGLVQEGIGIEHPDAVNKTWPGFWNWVQSTGASVV